MSEPLTTSKKRASGGGRSGKRRGRAQAYTVILCPPAQRGAGENGGRVVVTTLDRYCTVRRCDRGDGWVCRRDCMGACNRYNPLMRLPVAEVAEGDA